jgi:chemotaxis protein histidine kinase CheA
MVNSPDAAADVPDITDAAAVNDETAPAAAAAVPWAAAADKKASAIEKSASAAAAAAPKKASAIEKSTSAAAGASANSESHPEPRDISSSDDDDFSDEDIQPAAAAAAKKSAAAAAAAKKSAAAVAKKPATKKPQLVRPKQEAAAVAKKPATTKDSAPAVPLLIKIRQLNNGIDVTKIIYYTTPDRGVTICKASNNKDDFTASNERMLQLDPLTINAIRYGFDGSKGVWQARFSNFTHEDHQGWETVDYDSLIGIDKDLFANAKREPMKTVELADGARGNTAEDPSACGLAHLSLSPPVPFRAPRTGDAASCVLAAYGNVISLSINPKQKGLEALHGLLNSTKRLLCKDAANTVRELTGIQTAKVKMSTEKLYPTLLSKAANGKFMDGEGGLYVVSPQTAEGAAGHMIGIDADKGLIYDCAETVTLPLTEDYLDRCAGDNAMCVGLLRMRQIQRPVRGKRGKRKPTRKQKQKQKAKKQKTAIAA